jgi:Zn-dependent protease with chaperone function
LFTNLIFLILVLLLISITPQEPVHINWPFPPDEAFFLGLLLYAIILFVIYFQIRLSSKFFRRHREFMHLLVNCELLTFLGCYHFILGAPRLYAELPQSLTLVISLLFYLGGLGLFHSLSGEARKKGIGTWKNVMQEILLIVPFALPFLILTLTLDLISYIPNKSVQLFLAHGAETWVGVVILVGLGILFLISLMIFLPYWIQKIWQCQPLEESPLKTRLEAICKLAKFRHAGFKTWTVLNQSLTAAIIGILPRLRYIMFTKRLLQEMPPEQVEAILVHEIGHNYRRHLWIYPWIILGMTVLAGLFSVTAGPYIDQFWTWGYSQYPSNYWELIYPLAIFIPYAIIVALYFRIVFGFFSRLFERQADLHVFVLHVPPEYLIESLNHIAIATGNSHRQPNWHHFSIQERMDFLQAASQNPSLVTAHNRKVKYCLVVYFIVLIIASTLLFIPYIFP